VSPAFDPYVLRQASCQASLLVRTAGFPVHDFDDLRQDLLLDLLRRSSKFNPRRGEWHGFVRGVVRNHATVLARCRYRRSQREVLADDLFGDDQDLLESLKSYDTVGDLHLKLDVAYVLAGLPAQLRLLARLLIVMPVGEIPSRLGKSRSRVHQLTCQLRNAFVRAGVYPRVADWRRTAS
jgi:DNA-directed RNA polymerase specialized sigma24 family protein